MMLPIERAARALGECYDGCADPVDTPNNWGRAVAGVRAVLEAIREPSDAMLDLGLDVHIECGGGLASYELAEMWRTMIDAALKDTR